MWHISHDLLSASLGFNVADGSGEAATSDSWCGHRAPPCRFSLPSVAVLGANDGGGGGRLALRRQRNPGTGVLLAGLLCWSSGGRPFSRSRLFIVNIMGCFTSSAFFSQRCLAPETPSGCTPFTAMFPVVADLIVKLAKEKFGAVQTEYQKVTVGVSGRPLRVCFCCRVALRSPGFVLVLSLAL